MGEQRRQSSAMYLLFSLQCVKIKEEKASTVEVLAFLLVEEKCT